MRQFILAALLLSACDAFTIGNPSQNQLDTAKRRWNQTGPASYEYKLRRICLCPPELIHTLRVRVESGQITSVFDLDTNLPASSTGAGFTVPQLFDIVQDAIARRAFRLAVQYDQQLGYPAGIAVDYVDRTADDEITYLATELAPI